jgi:hypothetical protein
MRFQWIKSAAVALAGLGVLGCAADGRIAHNLPPSQRLLEPGPGVGGPGPGVITPASCNMAMGGMGGGAMAGGGCPTGACGYGPGIGAAGDMVCAGVGGSLSQIAFLGVEGAEVAWDVGGQGMFDSTPLVMPGRQNFQQGAIYRLKLTNIPDRPGVELYPTLEVAPATPRTDAFLAHTPVPIQFTDEDLDQVLAGNFVTKVIYLPDPEFQDLALPGVETLVSTRLAPGVDPIVEADRRGSILAILRIGNLDLQLPGSQTVAMNPGVEQAQYMQGAGGAPCGPGGCMPGAGAAMGGPMGMPAAAFAPQAAPPNLISGVNGPQYGMPYVGTPIGLPGPPHIPLGHQAGLTQHIMKNHTRVKMPPPVAKMKMTVKQRPGMDYPRPVNHVNVSEVNRAPLKLFGGTTPPLIPTAIRNAAARIGDKSCQEDGACYEGDCPQ